MLETVATTPIRSVWAAAVVSAITGSSRVRAELSQPGSRAFASARKNASNRPSSASWASRTYHSPVAIPFGLMPARCQADV